MEINLHVCPPELGLTASLAMLGLCKRCADLDRFRPSSSFSDWQWCNRGSTETYHNILCNSSRFHSFCHLLQQHQNKFLLPYLYLFQKLLLQPLPLGKGKENKLAFTLLPHCSGTKLLNIYTLHCHIFGEEVTPLLGDIVVQCQEPGSKPNGGVTQPTMCRWSWPSTAE